MRPSPPLQLFERIAGFTFYPQVLAKEEILPRIWFNCGNSSVVSSSSLHLCDVGLRSSELNKVAARCLECHEM